MTTNYKHAHLYYLASPYSHENREVMNERARLATKAAVDLLNKGIYVFAPIPYNAPWEAYELPFHWDFWAEFDKAFVSRMDAVVVLQLEGWDKSRGVAAEVEFANENGIPVYHLTLDQIENSDLSHIEPNKVKNDRIELAIEKAKNHLKKNEQV